jgi:2-polyprenyl-3-methyl-5-hydroxy-6-metoxy-1,4-benzoquinol methylase
MSTVASSPGVIYETLQDPSAYLEAYNALMEEPSNRLRVRAVTEVIRRVPPGVRRVVDIACGGGAYAAPARKALGGAARFFPIDRQAACTGGYRLNHPDAAPARADVTALPFAAAVFDLALCLDIIEHLDDDLAFLQSVGTLLAPGGHVVISTQNARSLEHLAGLARSAITGTPWRGWDPTHVRFYTAASLTRLLDAAGFDVVAFDGTYYWPFHLPARVASWPFERAGLRRLARVTYAALAAPGYAINAAFEALSPLPGVRAAGWGIVVLGRKR